MDSNGHWHNDAQATRPERVRGLESPLKPAERPVITCTIGSRVEVRGDGGTIGVYRFDSAERNKVRLSPIGVAPHLDFAEVVTMTNCDGQSCKAQVWDNRGGELVLRTLPV